MSNRAKLNGWHVYRISAHASASGHLVLWNKRLPMAFHAASCSVKRPLAFPRAAFLTDAWLSCAGSGDWAPEVGNSKPGNMIRGRSVPPPIRPRRPTVPIWGGARGPGPLSGEVSVPNPSPNTIVAKVYGGGAEVLEPNWLGFSGPRQSTERWWGQVDPARRFATDSLSGVVPTPGCA